jgi:predicted DNA-binding transcriptional regulator AlpA
LCARTNDSQPETDADDRPTDVVRLTDALAELTAMLPGLKAALERQPETKPRGEPPLAYRKAAAARMCGMSQRTLERLLSGGRFPRPNAYAGKCPLWTRATLERWLGEGGGRI